jgi:hypothetical protein
MQILVRRNVLTGDSLFSLPHRRYSAFSEKIKIHRKRSRKCEENRSHGVYEPVGKAVAAQPLRAQVIKDGGR